MGEIPSNLSQVAEKYKKLFNSIISWFSRENIKRLWQLLPELIFSVSLLYYIYNLSMLSVLIQMGFGNGAHDVGIYDQIIWLMSRFLAPYSTLGGVNLFGFHASFYCMLLAPFFWLWPNINFLYVIQSIFLGSSAIPVFIYAKKRLNNSWMALAIGLSFLLYPALQNMNMENFHPEALVVFFVAWAIYFMLIGNFRMYYMFLILSIIGKEEVSLTAVFLGLYLWIFKKDKKNALASIFIGIAWYLFCMKILMPWANGILFNPVAQPMVYSHWFGAFSQNIFNPLFYWNSFFSVEVFAYLNNLLQPVLYTALLSPSTIFLLIPALAVNVLSGVGYFRSIYYHYNYVIIAVVFFSTVEGFIMIHQSKKPLIRNWLFTLLGVGILCSSWQQNMVLARFPVKNYSACIRSGQNEAASLHLEAKRKALRLIPKDAKIAVSYSIWPQLSHRREIYLFPNPFREAYWTEGVPRPSALLHAEYVIIEWNNHSDEDERLIIRYLMNSAFYKQIYWGGSLMILQRTAVLPGLDNSGANYSLYLVDEQSSINDDFTKYKVSQKGFFSMLQFPDSNYEFRNLLGESIPKGKGIGLQISGYLFVPENGKYRFDIACDADAILEIEGNSIKNEITLSKGFHPYILKYLNVSKQRYNLKILVTPPLGKPYIIPDSQLMRDNRPDIFSRFIADYDRKIQKMREFDETRRNLLSNADFEVAYGNQPKDWSLECWQEAGAANSFVLEPDPGRQGRLEAKLLHKGLADSRWTQIVAVQPNTTYKLSGWIKSVDIDKKGEGAYLQASGTSLHTLVLFGTNNWKYVEVVGRTGLDQKETKIECRLGNYGAPNTGTAYFDNIVFKEISSQEAQ